MSSTQASICTGATQVHIGDGVDHSLRGRDCVETLAVDHVFSWDAVQAKVMGMGMVLCEWSATGVVGWRPGVNRICGVTPALVARGCCLSSSGPYGTGGTLLEVELRSCTTSCRRWRWAFGVSFGRNGQPCQSVLLQTQIKSL